MNMLVIYINNPITLSWITRSEKVNSPICIGAWEVSSSMRPQSPGPQMGVNSRGNQSLQVFHLILGSLKGDNSAHQYKS